MDTTKILESLWFVEDVEVTPVVRTGRGVVKQETVTVPASISTRATQVTTQDMREVTTQATVLWSADALLPPVGSLLTLPARFGVKKDQPIITARRVSTPFGPDHIEVTV